MQQSALYILLLSLAAAPALMAQSDPPAGTQPPQSPRDLMVAPSPAEKAPEARTDPDTQSAGLPANVCAELVAFLQRKEAQPASHADATKVTEGSQAAKPGTQTAGPGQTAPPMDQVQQRSGLSAPVPQDATKEGTTQVNVEQARTLAQSNDLRGCQGAARQMRRAGVALPAGLLVLAALREDLLAKSQSPAGHKAPKSDAPTAAPF